MRYFICKNNYTMYVYMERDLINISIIPRSKHITHSATAKKIEPCIINGENLILKFTQHGWDYKNEKNAYITLQNENFLPKLRYFDDKNKILAITDVGKCINEIKDFNLKDYEKELVNIIDIMHNKYGLYHNDSRPHNICISEDNNIKLIDFDRCSEQEKEDKYAFRTRPRLFKEYYR